MDLTTLPGGATAVLLGWRPSTVAVDIKVDPESDRVFRALPRVKEELEINVELAAPDQLIPAVPGWEERSAFIAREGRLSSITTTSTPRRSRRSNGGTRRIARTCARCSTGT